MTKEELHRKLLVEFDKIQSAVREERDQCVLDRRFYSIPGAQWEDKLGEQFENKPKMEVNKIHLAVIRIFNEYRNNRISVDFVSKDGADPSNLATVLDGLYRADEQDSVADEAYDNAFEEAVGGGFGAWRLRNDYEDEFDPDNDKQRIFIEPIYDADKSVYFDNGAKRQDKSDAKYCFIITQMTKADFKEEYDDDPSSWPTDITKFKFEWSDGDYVYVAECYLVEEDAYKLYYYSLLDGSEERIAEDDLENAQRRLDAVGATLERTRTVRRRRVHKYIACGGGILEDCGYIAGDCIPVVPVYGKRWYISGVEHCMGHVRLCKDAQRLKNMQLSKLAEISSLSSTEKPILTPEQISGHEDMWSEDNLKNYPYLLINTIKDEDGKFVGMAPAARTKPPAVPPALAQLLNYADVDIKELLGNVEEGEKVVTNLSGKAIEAVQAQIGMQSFIYISNMAKAMRRSGQIWLSMAKEIFVESGRKMKSVGKTKEISSVEINKSALDPKSAMPSVINNIENANHDVTVSVGPSSASRRAATVRAVTGMMQLTKDQETTQVLTALAMMNVEGEGIDEVRQYFRDKLIKLGVLMPTPEEAQRIQQELAQVKPDPNALYLEKAAAAEEAKAQKTVADTALSVAKTEKTRAETVETLAGINAEEKQSDE